MPSLSLQPELLAHQQEWHCTLVLAEVFSFFCWLDDLTDLFGAFWPKNKDSSPVREDWPRPLVRSLLFMLESRSFHYSFSFFPNA